MRVESVLSEGKGPWAGLSFRTIAIEVCHRDAHRRLCIPEFEIPSNWSNQAGQYLAINYARRHGVPAATKQIAEEGVPEWLLRSEPDYDALAQMEESERFTHESSVKTIIHRMVGAWTYWGWTHGFFDTEGDARNFYNEWCYLIATQQAMPATPQWAQTGLHWAYGTDKPSQNHYYIDANNGDLQRSQSAYERPLHHHCFIYGVEDDLAGEGGIADLWQREMRVFQRGSGAGANLSGLRANGERLSNGQEAGGLIPFIEAGEQAAATIRLPNMRPAQKLTLIDADHPDVSSVLRQKTYVNVTSDGHVSARLGIRVADACLHAAQQGQEWSLNFRSENFAPRMVEAESFFRDISRWQYQSQHGVVQFSDTINYWHGFRKHDAIRASSPDGAFMFFNDSACDVVTINAAAYVDDQGQLDIAAFEHTTRLMVIMSDIAVTMAHYPSQEIAYNSYRYRPIGLSMTNLALMLLRMGYGYDSAEGRAIVAACGALLTGKGYKVSAEIACEFGAFEAFSEHRDDMLRILWQHHEAAFGRDHTRIGGVAIPALDHSSLPDAAISEAVQRIWDSAMISGDEFGYSNAQISLIAASPNVALLMDQVSQGAMPLPSIEINRQAVGYEPMRDSIMQALKRLGYSASQCEAIAQYVYGHHTLQHAPHITLNDLQIKGFTDRECQLVSEALEDVTTLQAAFDPLLFGDRFCRDVLHLSDEQVHDATFNLLQHLGYSAEQQDEAQAYVFGHATLEEAPFLRQEDTGVFAGLSGNAISVSAQLAMMGGLQSFLSGGIAHHIALQPEVSMAQHSDLLMAAWQSGLKQISMSAPQPVTKVALPQSTARIATVVVEAPVTKQPALRDIIHPAAASASMQSSIDALADLIEQQHDLLQVSAKDVPQPQVSQPQAKTLPSRCRGYQQVSTLGEIEIHLSTKEYADGSLAAFDVTLKNAAPMLQQAVQQSVTAICIALQHHVPLHAYKDRFSESVCGPSGMIEGNPDITKAHSILDYVLQELLINYGEEIPELPEQDEPIVAPVENEIIEAAYEDDYTAETTFLAYSSLA